MTSETLQEWAKNADEKGISGILDVVKSKIIWGAPHKMQKKKYLDLSPPIIRPGGLPLIYHFMCSAGAGECGGGCGREV